MPTKPHADASRRRERSRVAILQAAVALCREHGYRKLSVEGIAARAGVGKHTIYRWWSSKGHVVLEALRGSVAVAPPIPDTGDIVADMRTVITSAVGLLTHPEFGPLWAGLIGEAQHDRALQAALIQDFQGPARAPIVERLRQAQRVGQLPATFDPESVLEVLFGALHERLLLRSGPLNAAYASFVVDLVLAGHAGGGRRRGDSSG